MAKKIETKQEKKIKEGREISEMEAGKYRKPAEVSDSCNDKKCPFHGNLSTRGRKFEGYAKKIFPKRIVLEFQRVVYYPKYERYAKMKTRIHAHLPDCLANNIKLGDYVIVSECRPLSKIIHHVVISKKSIEKK